MICLECRKPMTETAMGAYLRCCNGIGYYCVAPPPPGDRWFGSRLTQYGYVYRNWFRSLK